jgi:RNA polymerase sigma-70 factor (ECF subfamily)
MYSEKTKIEFLELLEPELAGLNRFARAMASNSDDAKDIVSETVLRAYESFKKVKDKSVFKSYLFTIASRHFKRTNKRMSIFSKYDDDILNNRQDNGVKPDISPDVEFLYKMLDKLPSEQKEALILYEINGFKVQEIAELQEVTESAVKSRLKRGREKLTELMTDNISKKKQIEKTAKVL